MYNRAARFIQRLPQTSTQLSRGFLALGIGSIVAVITILLMYLLAAPLWFSALLFGIFMLSLVTAVGIPLWLWLYQPFVRGNPTENGDPPL